MVHGSDITEISPPAGLAGFFHSKGPKLWSVGNPTILNGRLLGIISARQIDSDLALKSSQLIKQLASLNQAAFVGGWHAPLEEEALRILTTQEAQIVFCVSKSLNRFNPPKELGSRVGTGDVLLLTHCSPKAKRINRDASIRRNELVVGLATAVLVLSAPAGSATLRLGKAVLRDGIPVFTPEHHMNNGLLACGAASATFANLRAVLR